MKYLIPVLGFLCFYAGTSWASEAGVHYQWDEVQKSKYRSITKVVSETKTDFKNIKSIQHIEQIYINGAGRPSFAELYRDTVTIVNTNFELIIASVIIDGQNFYYNSQTDDLRVTLPELEIYRLLSRGGYSRTVNTSGKVYITRYPPDMLPQGGLQENDPINDNSIIELPGTPISLGTEWKITVPYPAGFSGNADKLSAEKNTIEIKFTCAGFKRVGKRNCLNILYNTRIAPKSHSVSDNPISLSLEGKITGVFLFSNEEGRVIQGQESSRYTIKTNSQTASRGQINSTDSITTVESTQSLNLLDQ